MYRVYAETKRSSSARSMYSTQDIKGLINHVEMLQEDNGKLQRRVDGLAEQNDARYETIQNLKKERSRREQLLVTEIEKLKKKL